MSVLKRLLPYIILNILVSALVTLAVLAWWNSSHPAPSGVPALFSTGQTAVPSFVPEGTRGATVPVPSTRVVETVFPSATPQSASLKLIEIAEVIGSGNLGTEAVLLRRLGDGELRLNGWKLDDEAGHRYTFPDMVLFKNGAVRLYTRTGANTVNDLYWGLKDAVWTSGKTAVLSDEKGNPRASLTIP